MFPCPRCRTGLARATYAHGAFWACPSCRGRAVALSTLRKAVPAAFVDALWHAAREGRPSPGHRRCPICTRPTVEVVPPLRGSVLRLDVCRGCSFVWFDPDEHEALPAPAAEAADGLAGLPDPRWALAMAEIELIARRHRDRSGPAPDAGWALWPALLGLPVEWESQELRRVPAVTWMLGALIAFVSLAAIMLDLGDAIERWGLVPADAWRQWGLTLITAFFLHGGLLHLAGNLYFLLMLGDNVEDALGAWPYLALIGAATLAGDVAHAALDPRPGLPLIGASGGISGVIVYYALAFPQARLGFLLWFGWRIRSLRWLRIPAWVVLIGWVLVQLLGAAQQVSGFTNVSALGHLGGAAVGFVFWLVSAAWARSDRAREPGIPAAEPPVAIPPERERQLAFVLIGVAVLALVLTRRLELGVGFALLFLAAQVLYCYRFNLMVDWAWSLGAGVLGFVYLFFRGLRWDRALVVASAISGAMVGYRALRDWNRPLLEE